MQNNFNKTNVVWEKLNKRICIKKLPRQGILRYFLLKNLWQSQLEAVILPKGQNLVIAKHIPIFSC